MSHTMAIVSRRDWLGQKGGEAGEVPIEVDEFYGEGIEVIDPAHITIRVSETGHEGFAEVGFPHVIGESTREQIDIGVDEGVDELKAVDRIKALRSGEARFGGWLGPGQALHDESFLELVLSHEFVFAVL